MFKKSFVSKCKGCINRMEMHLLVLGLLICFSWLSWTRFGPPDSGDLKEIVSQGVGYYDRWNEIEQLVVMKDSGGKLYLLVHGVDKEDLKRMVFDHEKDDWRIWYQDTQTVFGGYDGFVYKIEIEGVEVLSMETAYDLAVKIKDERSWIRWVFSYLATLLFFYIFHICCIKRS